jgi:hypothetical protein
MNSTPLKKKRRSVLRLGDMVVVCRVATTEGLRRSLSGERSLRSMI